MEINTQKIEKGKVSVIIPCYQHGHFLPQAIQSVLKQTYPLWEIIIVNDGSTDNTHEVVVSYIQKCPNQIKYIQQKQQGQAKARKNALCLARGEFWLTLDADDILEPQMMAKSVEVLQKNIDVAAVASNVWIVGPNGRTILDVLHQNILPIWPDILYHNPWGGIAGILLRAEAIQKVGGLFSGHSGIEDWELWIRLAQADLKLSHIPQCLARYRQTSNSYSRKGLNMLRGVLAVIEFHKSGQINSELSLDAFYSIHNCLYQLLQNKAVLFYYGVAFAAGETKETLREILSYFIPYDLNHQLLAKSYIEGFCHYNQLQKINKYSQKNHAKALEIIREYLQNKDLDYVYVLLSSSIQNELINCHKKTKWYRPFNNQLKFIMYKSRNNLFKI